MKHLIAYALVSTLSLAGCMDEEEVDLETSTSALTGAVTMNWYANNGVGGSYLISNLATETCFLSGMKGSMTVAPGWTSGAGVFPDTASGKWRVQIYGTTPSALVTCIKAVGNRRTNVTWRTGDPTWSIDGGPNPTRRQCFAGMITATTSFDYAPAYLRILRNADNRHSVFGTNLAGRQASITATCVDAIDLGAWYYGNSGATTHTEVTAHNPWGANTVACGLNGLGGIFNSAGDDWHVGYISASDDYTFVSSPGTQGGIRCIR